MKKGKNYYLNHRNIVVLLIMAMLFLLCSTHLSHKIVKQQVISQQMAIVGNIYEKDVKACGFMLEHMFESKCFENEIAAGKKALLEFGYTQEGLEYLYRQKGLEELHNKVLMIQVVLLFFMCILLWQFYRKRQQQEELLICDINQREFMNKTINPMHYSSCNQMLVKEIQFLLDDLCAYKKEMVEVKKMAQNFVENVAHQIKTPLSCISISLDLLMENLQDKEQKETIEEAFRYLKNIETLMKKLLYIGRLESGKLLLKKEPVFLEEMINECKSILDPQNKRIVLDVECAMENTPLFYGDYEWLKEAFLNILKNCLEHDTTENPIVVRLVFQKEMIFIKIRDYGTGIARQDLAYIFDRFYIPEHAKSNHTGIGLNLAKLIIEKHFGMIEAVNHEKGGAVFSIVFPVYQLKNEKI